MNLPRFGVVNPVPVNLLMATILVGGVYASFAITREFFPDVTPNMAVISLPYPGATPEEVEEGLALKVEDAIADLDEVEEIRTQVSEGGGGITVEFRKGIAIDKGVDEVQRAIDALTDLPEEAEEIQVVAFEPRMPAIMVTIYGDAGEEALKQAILQVRDELESLPDMGEIAISGVRDYEIRVDVSYAALLEHGISLPQVADAIGAWMAEVPGGTVRSDMGNIQVRTLGVPERAGDIRDIVVKATPQGQALRVGDIGTVREYFVDSQLALRFNGEPAVSLTVFKTGDQDTVEMAEMVRAYVAGRNAEPFDGTMLEKRLGSKRKLAYDLGANSSYPISGKITTHSDLARFIEGRLNLLLRNARWGALLVFATLLLFLNWRVALWVGLGLATALSGAILLMYVGGVTLNLLTMFGLIVVLGLLVDDAIVVAENIQTRHDAGEPALQAAITGTNQVFWPVVATVLTTVVAFIPLRFVEGQIGDLLGALPIVVGCALLMSLVEAVLILPSHMGHSLKRRDKKGPGGRLSRRIERLEAGRDAFIQDKIVPAFGRLLRLSLRFRYISVAIALAILVGTLGLVAGGRVDFTFLGDSDSETLIVDVRMPIGTPLKETEEIVRAIENAARALQIPGEGQEVGEVKSISAVVGQRQNLETGETDVSSSHVAQIYIELAPIEDRERNSEEIITALREMTGPTTSAAESVKYSQIAGGPGGTDITFEVVGRSLENINAAVEDIKAELGRIQGVYDVTDDNYASQRELQITLKESAKALGFDQTDVSRQIRGAIFGIDAHVFSDRREDIDVRVRLEEATRGDLFAVENLWVINPAGVPVPLKEIAELKERTSYSLLRRIDRRRAVTVTADCAPGTNPETVVRDFPIAEIEKRHHGVTIEFGGRQQNLMKAFATLPLGFAAALVMIYLILAWLFSSYTQPLAVMLGIPFGIIGVIWGHYLLGFDLTFLSLIGFVALSGIVVNDSLILVEFYNGLRAQGISVRDALVKAGMRRLRPIFLTTITTVFGLTPLMLEQSFQAQFLIPMAIAIAFGLASATVLILMVLPSIIVILDDVKGIIYFLWYGRRRPEQVVVAMAHDSDLAASSE